MIWFGLIIATVGYIIYRMDKNFKKKYEDKFNPKDWELPSVVADSFVNKTSSVTKNPRLTDAPSIADALSITETSRTTHIVSTVEYEKKASLLSPVEKLLFDALHSAVGDEYWLLAKIAAAEVIKIKATHEDVSFDHTPQQQFSFVVCDKKSFNVLCAIEFNDKIQSNTAALLSDPVLASLCQSIQLPALSINRQLQYDIQQLRSQLLTAMMVNDTKTMQANIRPDVAVNGTSLDSSSGKSVLNACPKCEATMVKRKARNVAQEEKIFWVCSRYPECKGRVAVND